MYFMVLQQQQLPIINNC